MSAYGDIRKPLLCTSTRWAAGPGSTSATVSGTRSISASAASTPPVLHRSASRPRSQAPVARREMPRRPVRRTTPRTTSSHDPNTVEA